MATIIESTENKLLEGGIFKEYVGNNSLHISNCLNTSRTIVLEMLKLRGYDISSISNIIFDDVNHDLLTIKVANQKENEITHVYYDINTTRTNHKKISKRIEDIMKSLTTEEQKKEINIIFIVLDGLTPSVKEAIKMLNQKYNIYIQVFPIKRLMYNVTKHRIVPEHIRIKKKTYATYLKDFLQSLHIDSLEKLPKILDTDPVAMFIGLRPGEMCKIIRPSQSAGIHNVFRLCVTE